ncbi:hypothetical protein PSTT_08494 [Puccinia striiformis]|uniref:Uncharacterized protein n=1 Tax=Puccinia striiformis TaxID=27350 RepID=A0A2S4VCD5_9BASI|nr:hypothetical protein PSTT_08494 [Puccinia striiformis]
MDTIRKAHQTDSTREPQSICGFRWWAGSRTTTASPAGLRLSSQSQSSVGLSLSTRPVFPSSLRVPHQPPDRIEAALKQVIEIGAILEELKPARTPVWERTREISPPGIETDLTSHRRESVEHKITKLFGILPLLFDSYRPTISVPETRIPYHISSNMFSSTQPAGFQMLYKVLTAASPHEHIPGPIFNPQLAHRLVRSFEETLAILQDFLGEDSKPEDTNCPRREWFQLWNDQFNPAVHLHTRYTD